jgi:hypothetical protein
VGGGRGGAKEDQAGTASSSCSCRTVVASLHSARVAKVTERGGGGAKPTLTKKHFLLLTTSATAVAAASKTEVESPCDSGVTVSHGPIWVVWKGCRGLGL